VTVVRFVDSRRQVTFVGLQVDPLMWRVHRCTPSSETACLVLLPVRSGRAWTSHGEVVSTGTSAKECTPSSETFLRKQLHLGTCGFSPISQGAIQEPIVMQWGDMHPS
jgi:hypothetical protein